MRIIIDMQGAQTQSRFRGIGRYTLSLAQAIVRNRGEHEIILALSGLFPETIEPIRAAFDGLLPQEDILVWYAPGPVRECESGNTWRRESAELIREAFLKSLRPDIIHISSLFEGYVDDAATSICAFDQTTPIVVTLYDLIPLLNPEQYLRPNPAYEQYYLPKIESLKQASAWLGISAFSVEDGCKALGIRKNRVFNISSACDSQFRPIEISPQVEVGFRQHLGIARPFVLYTGGADSRKNLHRLARAYAQLPLNKRMEYQLVLAGQMSEEEVHSIKEAAKTAGLGEEEFVITGYVTDEELVQLYNLCKLFVFPSCYEGFGLPVLEAVSCGAPVIASNTSSLPEIIDWEEALFDPFSETAIKEKILRALTDAEFNAELVSYGIERAKTFSWDASAKRAIAIYEQIYDEHQQVIQSAMPPTCRPKLAYISPLPPERSGIADYSAVLLPELSRYYDIEVIIAQPNISDNWNKSHCPIRSVKWFEQHAGEYDRVLYHFGNSPFHLHMFDLLPRFPGVVVLHDFFLSSIQAYRETWGAAPGAWALELYHAHGYAAVQARLQMQATADVISKYPSNYSVLQRAEGVIVHSAHSVRLAREWYGDQVACDWKVIPLLRQPSGAVDRPTARQKIDVATDDFVICSFGILDPAKQNQRLLEAWLRSPLAQNEHCYLIFVGQNHGGDYGERLLATIQQSGVKHRIRITGWVEEDTFRHYLAAADIAVQLRTFGRGETSAAVLDCMSYGLPTIVNANGTMADLPTNTVWLLTDEFKEEQLVEAMEKLWRDGKFRQELGERGREAVTQNHAPGVCAEQYATAIEDFYTRAQTNRQSLVNRLVNLVPQPVNDRAWMEMAASIAQNQPDKCPARNLFIDVSATCRNDLRTGIERVARALVAELIQSPPDSYRIEPVFLSDEGGSWHYRYARRWTLDILGCTNDYLADDLVDFQPQDLLLVADLTGGRLIKAEQAGIYQQLRDIGVCIHVVAYDLLPMKMPEMFPPGASEDHAIWLNAIIRVADGIICISQTVMNDLVEMLKDDLGSRLRHISVGWFHLGADIESSAPTHGLPKNSNQVLKQLVARPSFLMVGTIEPRKGHLQTLAAFEKLWQEGVDCNLVIVGKEGWKSLSQEMRRTIPKIVDALRGHPELGKRLFWLENISDEYLEKIYASSTCLIAASEGEGFGLPLIEAAQHKLPIIVRDLPVFREVAGEHAHYFSGNNASDLASEIKEWLMLSKNNRSTIHSRTQSGTLGKESVAMLMSTMIGGKWSRYLAPAAVRKTSNG